MKRMSRSCLWMLMPTHTFRPLLTMSSMVDWSILWSRDVEEAAAVVAGVALVEAAAALAAVMVVLGTTTLRQPLGVC